MVAYDNIVYAASKVFLPSFCCLLSARLHFVAVCFVLSLVLSAKNVVVYNDICFRRTPHLLRPLLFPV
jgi:hypothetical protein